METSINYTDIKMVICDIDGVMTDGSIHINASGEFFKSFNVKDGIAIELLRSHNIITGVISGKTSPALVTRCRQLGFDEIITDCKNKLPALENICNKYQIKPEQTAFLGDDILDIPIFKKVSLAVAPADAHALALENADWVTSAKGGEGVVREFADALLIKKFNLPLADIYKLMLEKIVTDDVASIEQ
jgi:3-deoxy-D-manno-octulosonate 8-phosphate phosphatase (KDO 8-P phosphatase)